MADALISALVDQLISRALQKIEQELRMVQNVKDDVKKLEKRLGRVQDLLADAASRPQANWLKNWLSDLEDLSYNIDDVLDEWNSAILKSQIQKQQEEGDAETSTAVRPKQVFFSVPSSCFCFKQASKANSHRGFAKRIKELNETLDRINNDGQVLGLVMGAFKQCSQQQSTSSSVVKPKIVSTISLVDETEIHGRGEDKEILVSKLLGESRKKIDIIPIVGMGGLGKTTLAQLAYNDNRVKTHFDKQIWVCVSEPFDEIRIVKAIIAELGEKTQKHEELETLVKIISDLIKGKKFLLVLDDVWTEEEEKWNVLKQSLSHGVEGSRILVTTRKKEVARMMGVAVDDDNIKFLSDEQSWLIIKQLAYIDGEDEDCKQSQEETGREIAKKYCKGLPLVAKVLGGLMRCKRSERQWEDILHSDLWKSKDAEDKIFAPFLLSYYDLPPVEKCCFSYCSVFPKDHQIERERLIDLWMSQGYVGDLKKGQECFENLVMRSFFQDFSKSEFDGAIYSCKMHDIMHDFAQFLTKNKSIIVEGGGVKEKMESLDDKTRHLTLVSVDSKSFLESLISKDVENNVQKNLRTLLCMNDRSEVDYVFSNFKGLRALSTWSSSFVQLPEDFATLIHLRYLDISGWDNLIELPEALCDLCNLQTLKMDYCYDLRRLPEGIGKLVNLRHLYIFEDNGLRRLEGLPKGFGKLTTSLEKLDMMVIPKNKEAYFHFGDLKGGNHYQFQDYLCIRRCRNYQSVSEAEKTSLVKMKDLAGLELEFGEGEDNADPQHEDMILEALKPHPNLNFLHIEFYSGTKLPNWMTRELRNLRYLRLWVCPNCENLPPLGKLPCLETLKIAHMNSVEEVGNEFLGITEQEEDDSFISFPKLTELQFYEMENWKKWELESSRVTGSSSFKVMPCLRKLMIEDCYSFEGLPDFLRKDGLLFRSSHGSKWESIMTHQERPFSCDN